MHLRKPCAPITVCLEQANPWRIERIPTQPTSCRLTFPETRALPPPSWVLYQEGLLVPSRPTGVLLPLGDFDESLISRVMVGQIPPSTSKYRKGQADTEDNVAVFHDFKVSEVEVFAPGKGPKPLLPGIILVLNPFAGIESCLEISRQPQTTV